MNRFRCEVCGKEDTLFFQCNYCGGYLCAEHNLPENHDCSNKPKKEITTKSEENICIECKTKLNDGAIKHVTDCSYCHRSMCSYHLRPRLVFIRDFKDTGKEYKTIQEIIEKDLHADGGHPCFPYTKIYWKEYDKQQEEYKKQLEQLVHKPLFAHRKEEELEEAPYEALIKKSHLDKKHYQKESILHLLKKFSLDFLKFITFSIFTIITGLPLLMYLSALSDPNFRSTSGLLYLFNLNEMLWYVIIPNLSYVITWVIVVYKILRGGAKWWYHLVLLIFGLWNWWGLSESMLTYTFLKPLFQG